MSLGGLIILWTVVMLLILFVSGSLFIYGLAVVMAVMMAYLIHTSNQMKDVEEKLDQLLEQQKNEES